MKCVMFGVAQEKEKTGKKGPNPKCHAGFCGRNIQVLLRGNGVKAPAHGSSDMPVWRRLFAAVDGHDEALVNMRISNLVHYLESLQAK